MTEFNPNCGRCGMLNSFGFCSLTACRYPSNVIVVEPKVIRGMMVNPHIEKPMTHFDKIKAMSVEELAEFLFNNVSCSDCTMHGGGCSIDCEKWMLSWLKSPVEQEVDNG